MLCGVLALDALKRHRLVPVFVYWPLIATFGLCVVFSGSRAGLFSFIIDAFIIQLAQKVLSKFRIKSFWTAILMAVIPV